MKSTEYFGQDPEVFRPERFMEADNKTRAEMERLVEMEFGYGRFGCAGKPLALMELNKVYFEVSLTVWYALLDCDTCADLRNDCSFSGI